jgi:carbonic anhydrase/acetyltransferase-like protein (isoleucine patch superfamily)
MGQLYEYRGILPTIAASATLFPTAEITGDVVVGERTIIGAGVKIIGDSHGPVRIGSDVQILENTVLHLLPDNELIIEDGVIVGPGAMIHGCRIGARSIVEPGAIVCDSSELGAGCVVRAGAVVNSGRDSRPAPTSTASQRSTSDAFPTCPPYRAGRCDGTSCPSPHLADRLGDELPQIAGRISSVGRWTSTRRGAGGNPSPLSSRWCEPPFVPLIPCAALSRPVRLVEAVVLS